MCTDLPKSQFVTGQDPLPSLFKALGTPLVLLFSMQASTGKLATINMGRLVSKAWVDFQNKAC